LLHQGEAVLDLLRLRLLLDVLDCVELVPHLGEGVDHARVHHAGRRIERLPQLGVREHHALERTLMIDPRQLVLFEEVLGLPGTLSHQLTNVLGAIVEIQVQGAAHRWLLYPANSVPYVWSPSGQATKFAIWSST